MTVLQHLHNVPTRFPGSRAFLKTHMLQIENPEKHIGATQSQKSTLFRIQNTVYHKTLLLLLLA